MKKVLSDISSDVIELTYFLENNVYQSYHIAVIFNQIPNSGNKLQAHPLNRRLKIKKIVRKIEPH